MAANRAERRIPPPALLRYKQMNPAALCTPAHQSSGARSMAHKKAGGSSRNGRDSDGRRLGVKKFGGERVIGGNIIVRQRGTKFHAGPNVGMGTDHTLFATADGTVVFEQKRSRQYVSVTAPQAAE